MYRVNILVHVHAVGVQRNAAVLADALTKAGIDVEVTSFHTGLFHRAARAATKIRSSLRRVPPFDVNVFIETPVPSWFPLARVNCLIPNQEWLRDEDRGALSCIHRVLCKTHHAESIFREQGFPTEFLGFSSRDCNDETVPRDYSSFVHVAGRSRQKGTLALSRVWRKHPEWPVLHIFWHLDGIDFEEAPNIVVHRKFLSDEDLLRHQNTYGIHLCPSEAEGWGHYLVEAMSCKALVVTTDAPPMNELVNAGRGILVPYASSTPQRLGTNFYVDEAALERSISAILQMPISERERIGQQARHWFLQNQSDFTDRVKVIFQNLCEYRSTADDPSGTPPPVERPLPRRVLDSAA